MLSWAAGTSAITIIAVAARRVRGNSRTAAPVAAWIVGDDRRSPGDAPSPRMDSSGGCFGAGSLEHDRCLKEPRIRAAPGGRAIMGGFDGPAPDTDGSAIPVGKRRVAACY